MNIRRIPVIRATVESLELLKATAKKMVTVPGYTRSDGRVVAAHQKMVHYDPSKLFADVASGKGSHSQKKAHAALQAKDWWQNLSVDDKAIVVMSWATDLQEKASQSAAVSGWKKNAVAGKNPTVAQWQAFYALPTEKKAALFDVVQEKTGLAHLSAPATAVRPEKAVALEAHPDASQPASPPAPAMSPAISQVMEGANYAFEKRNAEDLAEFAQEAAASSAPGAKHALAHIQALQAKLARAPHMKPAPAAPVPDVISQDEIDAHSKLAAMESGPHYQKVAIAKLKADPEWQKLPPADKHAAAMALYQQLQTAASQSAAVSVAKKAMLAGKVPSKAQYLALVNSGMDVMDKVEQAVGSAAYRDLMGKAAANAGDAGKEAVKKLVKVEVQKAKAKDAAAPAPNTTTVPADEGNGWQKVAEGVDYIAGASGGGTLWNSEMGVSVSYDPKTEYFSVTGPNNHVVKTLSIVGVGVALGKFVSNGKDGFTSKMLQALKDGITPTAADDGPKEGQTKPGADGTLIFKDGRWRKVADLVVPGFKLIVDDGSEAFLEEMLQTKLLPVNAAYVQDALAKLKAESAAPKPTVTAEGGTYTVEASYPAGANDLSATVVKNSAGKYAVAFKMPDGNGIGHIKIFPNLDDAKAYAKAIVDGKAPPKLASVKRMKIGESLVKPAMSAVAAPSAPVDKPATFLTNTTDGHSKQWSMSVNGNKVMTQWGKIGAKQQTSIKTYGTKTEAYIEANKLLKKKKAGGYVAGADGHHQWDEGDLDAVKAAPDAATEKPKTKKAPATLLFPPKPYGVPKSIYDAINQAATDGMWDYVASAASQHPHGFEAQQAADYAKTVLAVKPKVDPQVAAPPVPKLTATQNKIAQIDPAHVKSWLASEPGKAEPFSDFFNYTNKAAQTKFFKWRAEAKNQYAQGGEKDWYTSLALCSLFGKHDQALTSDGAFIPSTAGFKPDTVFITDPAKIKAAVMASWNVPADSVADDGPKEGQTKQGVGGLLVLKDGHWVLANPDVPFKLKTKGKTKKSIVELLPHPETTNNVFMKQALSAAIVGDASNLIDVMTVVNVAGHYPKSLANITAIVGIAGLKFDDGTTPAPAAAAPAPKAQSVDAADVPSAAPKAAHKLVSVGSVKVQSMDAWTQTGPQAGSNPGGQFTDKAGGKWYVKFPKTSDHAKNELLAAKLYEMLGVAGPKLKLVAKNGQIGVASKWVEGTKQATPDKLKALDGALSNFAIDAWLSNWDVVGTGYDNLKVGPDGKAIRIDAGGSLLYRAQGEPKGDAFGDTVTELDSLLDAGKNSYSAAVFSGVTKEQMLPGLQQLAKLKPSQIETMVDQIGPGTADQKAALAKKLIARRAHILSKFGVEDPWNKPPPDEAKLPVDKAKLPKPIDFSNINGKPLSSKPHVNAQNSKDSAALVNFAGRGNLTALKSYKYDAVDKETGAALGKKSIVDHPAQLVKKQWIELVEHLQSIAYPTADTLSMPSLGIGGGSAYEIADAVGYYKPVDRVGTISAENRMGFFMKLASVDSVDDAIAESNWHWLSSSSKFMKDSKATFQNYSKTTKAYISNVQSSGWINHVWSKGEVGNVSGVGMSKEKLLAELYKDATELPDGMMLWRWMSDSEGSTVKSLMNAKPGDSFQNTDSMCSSFKESWGNSSHFGNAIRLKIRCAKGSKAILSYGSGEFANEGEFTTLPGARFVVVSTKKGIPGNANGVDVECIMLPPDEGYVAEVNKLASITKSITIRSLWQQNPSRSKPPRQSLRRLVRTRSLDMTS